MNSLSSTPYSLANSPTRFDSSLSFLPGRPPPVPFPNPDPPLILNCRTKNSDARVVRALIPADSTLCFLRVSESLVLNWASRALRAASMASAPSLAAAADIGFTKRPIGPSRQPVIFLPNVNPPGPLPCVPAGVESERGRDVGETARCAPAVEEETSCCAWSVS